MKYFGYSITGHSRGKKIGFPTINLEVSGIIQQNVQPGIHASHVEIGGIHYHGALFYGLASTFGQEDPTLEIYLIDVDDIEIPKHTLVSFEIVSFIRGVEKFETVEELVKQMNDDVEKVKKSFML